MLFFGFSVLFIVLSHLVRGKEPAANSPRDGKAVFILRPMMRNWFVEPIIRLNDAAKNLSQGNWEQEVTLSRRDEL